MAVELCGGLELLCGGVGRVSVPVPPPPFTVAHLIRLILSQYVRERPHLFADAATAHVRPGTLVLINDTDYEILSGIGTELHSGDVVVFISTLHGG